MTISQDSAKLQPDERRALLAQLLREKARKTKTQQPLSYGQRALWFIQQIAPESSAYHIASAVTIRSALDVPALQRALQAIVDRHESLRVAFVHGDNGPVREIYGTRDLVLPEIDATADDDATFQARLTAAYQQAFDLSQGDVLRAWLFVRGPATYVLLLVVHHICFDGWSVGLVLNELQVLYQAELSGVQAALPVPRPYSDYVAWQSALLAGSEGERMRAYWHRKLAAPIPLLNLPTDFSRQQLAGFRGASHDLAFDEELVQELRALARSERTTLFTVLLAGFYTLLHRCSGQDDIVVGSPMASRSQEFQQTVGYLVSPVALRASIDPSTGFRGLLKEVHQTVVEAISHQDYPFSLLVQELNPPREPGRSPIFDVMFNLQRVQRLGNAAVQVSRGSAQAQPEADGLVLEPALLNQEDGQFDLSCDVVETETRLFVLLRYNLDLFTPTTIERLAVHLRTLLAATVANPDLPIAVLPLLSAEEHHQLTKGWNATAMPYPAEHCLHELLAERAARAPAAVAATFEGASISYGELDRRANQLAHHLRGLGVGPDVLVGVYLERSLDLLVALLGVLKAGGAYVPLDPAFPRERLAYMLADAAAPVLLSQSSLAGRAPEHGAQVVLIDDDAAAIAAHQASTPQSGATPHNLAYVIYTSGSTGRPKGVQIEHRAVVNFLVSMAEQPGLAAGDVLVAVTTLSFDIAVLELYLPLLVGARIELVSRETASDGEALAETLERSGATVLQATPATWRLLLATGWRAKRPFRALCGGEALPPDLARDLLAAGVELWNVYGPTETTVWSARHRVEAVDGPVPIGRPLGNTQLYVLNQAQQPQPVGVVGELYIGGDGLARGYLNRPELTAERFVRDPFSDDATARMYRTGDLARWRADGLVEVLGRTDHQVKIRGFRIELGEIETVLREHQAVREAVVVDGDGPGGVRRLLAYLTAAGPQAPTSSDLRRHLRARLPEYMVPALFIVLEAIPLTPNGKVNRQALPAPERDRGSGEAAGAPPTTPLEQLIAGIWSEALGVKAGLHDTFFDLGGHSLLAVEVMTKIAQSTGVRLNPLVIRSNTLGQLAAMIEAERGHVTA